MEKPRVGILSAVETVNPAIPSTLDAAVLSKMAERGQIKGGIVDGPLAMDNAIDMEAARTKGITSLVAGRAHVLIAPNLEVGNMLAKELTFLAHAEAAGLVVGAKVPVILTSRADNDKSRLASCALALLYDYWRREGRPHALLAHARRPPNDRRRPHPQCRIVVDQVLGVRGGRPSADAASSDRSRGSGRASTARPSMATRKPLIDRVWPAGQGPDSHARRSPRSSPGSTRNCRACASRRSATASCTAGATTPSRCSSTTGWSPISPS